MRRAILAAIVVGLAATFGSAAEAQAQVYFGNGNFGIRIGPSGGYPYGGYGRGFGYGPGVGGMYGNYMVPGYPYYGTGRPSFYGGNYNNYGYRAPRRTVVAVPSQPVQRFDGLPIKIVSPDDSGVPLTYALNEYEYTIQPGESQNLVNDRNWVITFDRGGDFGSASYSLSPGKYEFALSDHGWELYHDSGKSTSKNALPAAP